MQHQISKRTLFSTKAQRLLCIFVIFAGYLVGVQAWRTPTAASALASSPAASNKPSEGETIVYTRNNREVRLIQPDGSNDRLIWQIPEGTEGEIESVAWRPDAQQIAFVSTHEATCSEFGSDIFLINPDGSNLRRLTNGPACAELVNFPQGSATVQIENLKSNLSQVLVYIEGAPTAKVVSVSAGSTVLVSFPQVADLGNGLPQSVVAINGYTRWFDAGVQADVIAGQNAHAGKLTITGNGFDVYGATRISWSPDGSRLAYQFGTGKLWQVGLNVSILGEGGALFDPSVNNSVLGVFPVWSPVGNEVLFQQFNSRPFTITRADVGGLGGVDVANVTHISGMAWLRDGSGFVVADDDNLLSHTDLYLMTFADNKITQLTQTTSGQVAIYPKVSPDNSQILYAYIADIQARPRQPQLRIMNRDGSDDHLLVENGSASDWSRVAPQNPPPATSTPTATATTQVQPTVTATPQGQTTPATTPTPIGNPVSKVYLPTISR
jgi:Tol biopolymer transport system component